ncbi:galactose/methyl galactoside ABC transporter ATP-binding protein MglA [Clostridium perfringens]|uniref:galactose/methyl galactoside ABC transporter ATP-binding protein MglA n=1 Tax=Clostridium perfringens TaxID=1502 RepID=UPI001DABCF08|nr:galactose/methyl galactoside ABC transporter ATP-binding protein MglA [Clostridium perfringens]EGS5727634.1 galactose/methyl galactoside ABC transporter ATP-binding protein MglA [Clostridium perfringens]EHK2278589.1 galactose/methyl galactoside ABC transporter ATP-binding protein MglA [Clostridium perfringens]ELC8403810.1 galactose/methyl galactoside ABC transporter ATP-binding protein MglA [Clostridium perfringens]MDC4243013.1 galactose/methyl galactoside ABC transporter ATP-binding protein
MKDSSNLLEMRNISKEFPGVKALDNVTLKVKKGSVHALMGENGAGKSTLMKCLFGIYHPNSGEIFISGQKVQFKNSKHALDNGVSMVHQELNQVRERNVMDNLWLGRYPKKGLFIDEKKMYDETEKIFKDLDINVNPRDKVSTLSVSQMQMVEIAKAVSYNSKIIVMDEPTSSLTEKEVSHLFKIINKLRKQGISIIYISHKMEEILEISDEVTIMRDGKWIATEKASDLTMDLIIKLMVGRELTDRFPKKDHTPKETILEVNNLSDAKNELKNVSFKLRKGEILGIAGLVGAKRTETLETLFGLREKGSGDIILHGKKVDNSKPFKAMQNGFALVTEERRQTGIFGKLPIDFNSIIANIDSYKTSTGLLANGRISKDTQWVIDSMKVKTPSQKTLIGSLSGGNQQKIVIGKWLLRKPEILLLDEPTRGIDVGAKFEIYQLINELAKEDKGIIMVSSEMPELLGVCDRILVMSNGRVSGIVNANETTQEEIMHLSAKYLSVTGGVNNANQIKEKV